ncbi:MarR family winged helix-turn-helix transcriptional regulator [Fimbriimonas ginsengisoli]|uniref:Transcriptional regulator, MarR family n=1 Tax=Fimbriimonas ginsengisoli Gsoil 348 TaxID=661478 RepID=A0A068NLY4_FIMGI|nr:MarR family transcriptional regulator [Fimbriimonas ginsengisoli]AIE84486.1 Transcriptional regulator, MarR family [Fimbriimonas ginsengisoli Gsoil 348]
MPTHYEGSEEERRSLDLYIKLVRASNRVFEAAHDGLEGLTPTQFGVLEALLHLGPQMPSQLAQKHLKSPNNMTSVLDGLEKLELVRRERCREDRRVLWIHLTEAGRELIAAEFPKHVRRVVDLTSALTPKEQQTLDSLLRKLGHQAA